MKQLPICRTKEEIVMFKNLKKMDKKATGLFKSELAKRMTIFKIPDLTFAKDESVEYGSKIDELLRGLNNKSEY